MAAQRHPRAAAVLQAVVADDGAAVPSHIATALTDALDNLCDPLQSAPKADVDRVKSWLFRSPWELRKCRALPIVLASVASLIGEKPTTELPLVSESRSFPIPGVLRNLLLQNHAAGLTHVRYAALATFTAAERPRASVSLKISAVENGPCLLVTVALGAKTPKQDHGRQAAVAKALGAATAAIEPVEARVRLPGDAAACALIGRGGHAIATLQARLADEVDLACALEPIEGLALPAAAAPLIVRVERPGEAGGAVTATALSGVATQDERAAMRLEMRLALREAVEAASVWEAPAEVAVWLDAEAARVLVGKEGRGVDRLQARLASLSDDGGGTEAARRRRLLNYQMPAAPESAPAVHVAARSVRVVVPVAPGARDRHQRVEAVAQTVRAAVEEASGWAASAKPRRGGRRQLQSAAAKEARRAPALRRREAGRAAAAKATAARFLGALDAAWREEGAVIKGRARFDAWAEKTCAALVESVGRAERAGARRFCADALRCLRQSTTRRGGGEAEADRRRARPSPSSRPSEEEEEETEEKGEGGGAVTSSPPPPPPLWAAGAVRCAGDFVELLTPAAVHSAAFGYGGFIASVVRAVHVHGAVAKDAQAEEEARRWPQADEVEEESDDMRWREMAKQRRVGRRAVPLHSTRAVMRRADRTFCARGKRRGDELALQGCGEVRQRERRIDRASGRKVMRGVSDYDD